MPEADFTGAIWEIETWPVFTWIHLPCSSFPNICSQHTWDLDVYSEKCKRLISDENGRDAPNPALFGQNSPEFTPFCFVKKSVSHFHGRDHHIYQVVPIAFVGQNDSARAQHATRLDFHRHLAVGQHLF